MQRKRQSRNVKKEGVCKTNGQTAKEGERDCENGTHPFTGSHVGNTCGLSKCSYMGQSLAPETARQVVPVYLFVICKYSVFSTGRMTEESGFYSLQVRRLSVL
jgi:hypothetical protein